MKAVDEKIWNKLVKCITNDATEQEREFVTNLIMRDERLRETYQLLVKVYGVKERVDTVNTSEAFEKLDERIREQSQFNEATLARKSKMF